MNCRFNEVSVVCTLVLTCILLISCSGSGPVTPSGLDLAPPASGHDDSGIPGYPVTHSSNRDSTPYAPGEILVVFKDGAPAGTQGNLTGSVTGAQTAAAGWLARRGLEIKDIIQVGWGTVYRLVILDGTSVPDKITELQSLPVVEYAEPNITFEFQDATYNPNDPFWENPKDNDEDPRTNVFEQFGPSKIGASALWNESVVGQDIVVCVMDSGIQVWHEDLKNVMWVNEDEIPDNGIDDDFNGYIDDIYGWDTYEDDNDITEYNGNNYYHGTSCSGVIAAEQDNNLGCSGIAPGARIMGIRIGFGYTFLSEILEGLSYARVNDADIISMSFGTDTFSTVLKNSMDYAWNHGLILTASAGNDDSEMLLYPAAFENVVCVGATSPFTGAWNYAPIDEIRISKAAGFFWGSNYGPQLEIMAFGDDYITLYGANDHSYYDGSGDSFFRGTSNSCPMVSGAFALLKSYYPGQTNTWLRERLLHTADDLDVPGFDEQTGYGRVNVVRACFGPDRYASEEDGNGFVDMGTHDGQVIDSIHASSPPYTDTEDLYKFTAPEDGYLNFFLDIWTNGEDLELALFDSPSLDSSSLLDQSVAVNHAQNSYEAVGTACEAGKTYYVQVTPRNYGDSTTYTLNVEYVEPSLNLDIETYNPGFTHLGRNNILLGQLDFSASLVTRITRISFNLQGTMPPNKLTGLHLYKDTYKNGTFDGLDQKVADAHINGTNRAIFSNLYEEISGPTSPIRYFLFADIQGVTQDALYQLVLSSYKDVVTAEGIEIAKDSFPYSFGPYEVGVDIEPPTWDTTVGAQSTVPRYEGGGVFWNNASDPRTPPVKYNVYWTDELPFEFSTAQVEKNVSFWDGGDYDHRWEVPGLENFQEYFVVVRAEDQAGNEDDNTVVLSVIPDDTFDPTWPQVVGSFDNDGNNAREVKADPANHRVFVADENQGLLIIDVTDPAAPSLVDSVEESAVMGVDYDGTYVYCAGAAGLVIVDPDGADGATVVTTVPFANALDLCVVGDWVYVTNKGTLLLPVDISDPENPVAYTSVASGNYGYGLCEQGGYLYVSTWDHPMVFDISDPSAPVEKISFGEYGSHDALAIADRFYVPYWDQRKLSIYDITDPIDPQLLGGWTSDSGYWGSGVVAFNGYMYFGTNYWGIEVLDVTDPEAITEVGQLGTNGPDGMDTDGVFIYSAENEHGLKVIL